MDIINVVSVIEPVIVSQWLESDDDEIKDTLYWRQTFSYPDSQLSVSGFNTSLVLADALTFSLPSQFVNAKLPKTPIGR